MSRLRTEETRNTLALLGDYVGFAVGFAFYDPLVVVPAFVEAFTGSALLVGVLSALRLLMITVPQVWAASLLAVQPRKKPLLVWSSVGGRLPILLLAGATWLWAGRQTGWVMAVLALSVMLFYTSEGLNSVSWPSLVGKVVPEQVRGRFFGIGQLLASVGAGAAGYGVNRILAQQQIPAAGRWGLLYLAAFIALMLSVVSMLFIREQPEDVPPARADVTQSLRRMWGFLRSDRSLRRVIMVQLVLYTAAATFPFVVIRAQADLPQAGAMLGTFLVMQSIGGAAAALLGGYLIDHVGSWAAIRLMALVEVVTLLAVSLAGWLGAPVALYLLVFLLMGFVNGGGWWSFSAYILDMATPEQRPIYLATNGIFIGITLFNPVVVAGLFEVLTPDLVFGAACVLALVGAALAWTLRHGRAKTLAALEESATL